MGSLQSVDQIVSSRFPLKGLMFCLDRYHAQFLGDCIHIYSDALDERMIVTTLIRCPRARLRLESDDKPCASSDGPKVVCSKS